MHMQTLMTMSMYTLTHLTYCMWLLFILITITAISSKYVTFAIILRYIQWIIFRIVPMSTILSIYLHIRVKCQNCVCQRPGFLHILISRHFVAAKYVWSFATMIYSNWHVSNIAYVHGLGMIFPIILRVTLCKIILPQSCIISKHFIIAVSYETCCWDICGSTNAIISNNNKCIPNVTRRCNGTILYTPVHARLLWWGSYLQIWYLHILWIRIYCAIIVMSKFHSLPIFIKEKNMGLFGIHCAIIFAIVVLTSTISVLEYGDILCSLFTICRIYLT